MRLVLAFFSVVIFASAALAAGSTPIPTQGLLQDAHVDFTDECVAEGITVIEGRVYANYYHRKPDYSDPHQAISVSIGDERPFAWFIIVNPQEALPTFYADSDRDGMAEFVMAYGEALARFNSDWCNVYAELRKGR